MINKQLKISYDNRGSALIMALVVSAVLMVLSFSLLAVSYSFYLSQDKNSRTGANEREMFYSAIESFEQELLNNGCIDWVNLNRSSIDSFTMKAYDDNNLETFGANIVSSIYNYCKEESGENIIEGIQPWKDTEDESRYFELTSIAAYSIKIQMYWEFDTDGTNVPVSDAFDNVLLHVKYFLEKKGENLINCERLYRLKTKPGSITKVETKGEYSLKFDLPQNKPEYSSAYQNNNRKLYEVDGEFLREIKIPKENIYNVNLFECSLGIEQYNNCWHTASALSDDNIWNGIPGDLGFDSKNKNKTVRTNWNHEVPICIKFVINGYCLDLNVYEYRYIKYVKDDEDNKVQYAFNRGKVNDNITKALLERCGVNNYDIDEIFKNDNTIDYDKIIWKLKDGGKYSDFFSDDDTPHINKEINKLAKRYYVYATFPSYYDDQGNLKMEKIADYVDGSGKIINPNGIFNMLAFDRIIGGEE